MIEVSGGDVKLCKTSIYFLPSRLCRRSLKHSCFGAIRVRVSVNQSNSTESSKGEGRGGCQKIW